MFYKANGLWTQLEVADGKPGNTTPRAPSRRFMTFVRRTNFA
jgi:hypothetical protein